MKTHYELKSCATRNKKFYTEDIKKVTCKRCKKKNKGKIDIKIIDSMINPTMDEIAFYLEKSQKVFSITEIPSRKEYNNLYKANYVTYSDYYKVRYLDKMEKAIEVEI